ncbi:MAG: hypothetical protein HXX09_07540 [Bacteroidetes bacterium]|nr:hypothetical protein [Bacteroidota bacterium]
MNNLKILVLITTVLLLSSCNSDEDKVKEISKEGSIETVISVEHLDSIHDILLTTNKVWIKGNEYKSIVHSDTIPFLGTTSQEAENSDGATQNVYLKKDYEVYITVK